MRPTQGLLVQRFDVHVPLEGFALTTRIVLPLAAMSRHLLESRALPL